MTKDILSTVAARRLATAALMALLPSAISLAATVPTHPRPAARTHHHAVVSTTAATSAHRHATETHATSRTGKPAHAPNAALVARLKARQQARHDAKITAAKLASHSAPHSAPQPAAAPPAEAPKQDAAATPPAPQTLRGRLANFFFGPLRGSHESLVRQNQRAQQDGLTRIQDDDDIARQVKKETLVSIPETQGLRVDERLPVNRRYTRPWTAHFLTDLARAHDAQFHSDLQVNSAVRTVAFQKKLLRINGNAAPAAGDDASSHLMGGTVDLAKKGMSSKEVQWMRAYLSTLQEQGKLDVEEEFQQSCFHIAVYKAYLPQSAQAPQRLLAENAHPGLHTAAPQNSSGSEN
jgi:hypothetical protein